MEDIIRCVPESAEASTSWFILVSGPALWFPMPIRKTGASVAIDGG